MPVHHAVPMQALESDVRNKSGAAMLRASTPSGLDGSGATAQPSAKAMAAVDAISSLADVQPILKDLYARWGRASCLTLASMLH